MKESELYLPLKRFLENQGYVVKGEIQDCDVVAMRGEEAPVIVELKLTLNLDVVLQAIQRLTLSPKVYIGVPVRCRMLSKRHGQFTKLLRMLGLGLVTIEANADFSGVEVILDPGEYRPRTSRKRQERLLGEFVQRVGDPNLGGATRRRGVMTAYRQRALVIARFLDKGGPTKAACVARHLQEPKARDILYRNVYGWFERASRGVYKVSPRGERELTQWQSWDPDEGVGAATGSDSSSSVSLSKL